MKGKEQQDQTQRQKTKKQESAENTCPVITVDYEKYAHFLDNPDLTEDQKREFIQALWNIMCEFVSLGFGVHPLQQAQNACGQIEESPGNPPILRPSDVLLEADSLNNNFENASGLDTDAEVEGVE